MKKRRNGLVVVLYSLIAIGIGNAKTDFHGVFHSLSAMGAVDSACLIVPPDSLTYATTGWGDIEVHYDTFDFPVLTDWPEEVTLKGVINGTPNSSTFPLPVADTWYAFAGVLPPAPRA